MFTVYFSCTLPFLQIFRKVFCFFDLLSYSYILCIGTVSPASLDGAAELQASSKHTEVLKLTEELATLTDKLKDDEKSKPSQEEMDEAVAQINRSLGEDDK